MEENKKSGWGGARKGAGRKPKGNDVTKFTFRLEQSLLDKVGVAAEKEGCTRATLVIKAIEAYLK